MPNTEPQKIGILPIHMSVGMVILALMVVRFIVRLRTSRPVDVAVALYHQFVRKDRLLRRMWFGRRVADPSAAAK